MNESLFEGLQSEEGLVLAEIDREPGRYRVDFRHWVATNFHIVKRFVHEADLVAATGRAHYSARTIGEVLRHQTALRGDDAQFKLNDHWWPDCARLWMALRPEHAGFFETRGR